MVVAKTKTGWPWSSYLVSAEHPSNEIKYTTA